MQTKDDLTPERLRQLYLVEGHTLQQIADLHGCSLKVVWSRCRKFGIPRRPGCAVWKGGRLFDKHGYVLIHQPHHPQANHQGYVREHRLVMEKALGRFLLPAEVVHHKDDNRANNDPENLQLFESNTEHLRHTLAGRCPQWTPEGLARMAAAADRRRRKDIPSPEKLAEMYCTMSATEIARVCGCTHRTVVSRLRLAGVEIRNSSQRYSHQWPTPDEMRAMLEKKPPRQIAAELGRKDKVLYAWLQRNGIDWPRATHKRKDRAQTSTAYPTLQADAQGS